MVVREYTLCYMLPSAIDSRTKWSPAWRQNQQFACHRSRHVELQLSLQATGGQRLRVSAAQKGFKSVPSKKTQRFDESSPTLEVDPELQKRLAAIQRDLPAVRKSEGHNDLGPLDYDAPPPSSGAAGDSGSWTDKPAAKVAFGVAAGLFALIFAFGDILPSSVPRSSNPSGSERSLSREEKGRLELQVKRLTAQLESNSGDREAVEGLAVSYAELGQYEKSANQLLALTKDVEDVEALRLLAEVRAAQGRFGDSALEYRRAQRALPAPSFPLLQGLTEALIADGKADESVQEILVALQADRGGDMDPVQVGMLLGRAYAGAGRGEEAESAYDQLTTAYPDDFRGYLAKAALYRQQGRSAEATRLFVQARAIAPEGAKGVVDRVAAQK